MNPVIHIGLPKTATTTLQLRYLANHADLHYVGSTVPRGKIQPLEVDTFFKHVSYYPCNNGGPFWVEPYLYSSLIWPDQLQDIKSRRYDTVSARTAIQEHLSEKVSATRTVISSETFSVGVLVPPQVQAERLRNCFTSATVILVIRNPLNWLESRYLQMARAIPRKIRSLPPYSEWLRIHYAYRDSYQSMFQDLRWGTLLQQYSRLFGRDHVHVLLLEEFLSDRPAFLRKLSDIVGADLENIQYGNVEAHLNPTIRQGDAVINRLTAGLHGAPYQLLQRTKPLVRRVLPAKARVKMDKDIEKTTINYLQPELDIIADEWNIPLRAWGYPIAS